MKAIPLALAIALLALTAQPVAAEPPAPYELTTLKDDGSIYLSLTATEATDIEGMSLLLDYDRDAFAMGGTYAPEGFNFSGNSVDGIFVLYGVEDLHLEAGDVLATVGFTASEAMDAQTEYTFACTIEVAYSDTMESFAWAGRTITCTYTDSTAATGKFTPAAGDESGVYTVTFVDDDGTVLSTQSVDAADPYVVLYEPERAGWAFAGWTLDGEPFDESTELTGSVTLAATWEESKDANDASRAADKSANASQAADESANASQAADESANASEAADESANASDPDSPSVSSGSRNPVAVVLMAAVVIGVLAFVRKKMKG